MDAKDAFRSLYDIVVKLRGPEGCPWDREQTRETLRDDLTEETYECIEAINEKDNIHIKEELGDLFLIVTMLSYMHEQEGLFTTSDVLAAVSEKLIRRHPHVFGDIKLNNSAEVLDNWAKIKVEQEGRKPKDSILDGVSQGILPLERAFKLQKKAAKAGFDWPDSEGITEKILEELDEVRSAIGTNIRTNAGEKNTCSISADDVSAEEKIEGELGDLLFSVVNLCRFLNVDPSIALARTNNKFIKRFRYVETQMKANGHEIKKENLKIMDQFWNEAKACL